MTLLLVILLLLGSSALFPLGDDNNGRQNPPYVTYFLIAANVAVFVFAQGLGANQAFTYGYSVIPREIISGHDIIGGSGHIVQAAGPHPIYLTIFSAMFMHGSLLHIAGNMLYLWIFGDNIEDAMGHGRFLVFYLLCGVIATLTYIYCSPASLLPSLGASGAIAGVLGAYLLLYPTRSVRVLIGWVGIVAMPAIVVIGLWAILQFLNGFGSIARTSETAAGGVAYMAHVGGFVAGLLLIKLFARPGRLQGSGSSGRGRQSMWR
jgi:membrane associated rhomboid family serine protease